MAVAPDPEQEISSGLLALDAETDALTDVWEERPGLLARLVERAEAAGCVELLQQLRWEAMLAYAYTSNAAIPGNDRSRFIDFDSDLLADDALDYLVGRSGHASAYVRSRILDFLWEYGGAARRRHAVDAGAAYLAVADLEVVKVATENISWERVGDAVVRAAQLVRAANQRATYRAVADRALSLVQQLMTSGAIRYVFDMALALVELAEVLTDTEKLDVDAALSEASQSFAAVDDYHFSRVALSLRRQFAASCKQTAAAVHDIDVAIVHTLLDEGDRRARDGAQLVASMAYGEALKLLEKIGSETALIAQARSAVRRSRVAGMAEMTRISSGPIQLTSEHEEQITRVIETVSAAPVPDCFELVARHPALLVTRAEAERSDQAFRQASPLSFALPRVIMRSGGQVLAPEDPVQAARLQLMQTAIRIVRMQDGLMLNTIVERLIARTDVGPDDLIGYLDRSGHIPASSLPIIAQGVRRVWAGDWVSTLHILVPRLEEVMRSMLRAGGHDTMRSHKSLAGVTVEVPLSVVLDRLAAMILDDDVNFMLAVNLDFYGLNMRNAVGHGLIDMGDCTIDNVARVLQLYCILAGLRRSGAAPAPPPPPPSSP
jgi:hypothetical protein